MFFKPTNEDKTGISIKRLNYNTFLSSNVLKYIKKITSPSPAGIGSSSTIHLTDW
jgi:hypothetical protein